jgi:hypothetical protein
MTDTVETQIDEILMKHNGELGVTWESPDVVTPDTKQALLTLIEQEVLKAKIDGIEVASTKLITLRYFTSPKSPLEEMFDAEIEYNNRQIKELKEK